MFRYAHRRKYRKNCVHFQSSGFEILERRDLLSGAPPTVVNVEVASTSWTPAFVQFLRDSTQGTNGYSIPRGSTAQSASLTWDNIDQIMITFSEDVDIDAADLSLSGKNHADYTFSGFHYDPDPVNHRPTATWTLSAPLDRDRLRLDLDATGIDPVTDLDGNILDGEWTNNVSTVSGNGTPGGDFQFNFNVLPTDVNNTGNINNLDSSYIHQLDGKTTASAGYIAKRDVNGDGIIDNTDWYKAISRTTQALPTGVAAGTNNDAPTAVGYAWLRITGGQTDGTLSLSSYFGDAESGSSGLTYSIVSNDNPSLFETASIDAPASSLVVHAVAGASGRGNIVIRATDAGGLSIETVATVDVNYDNVPPLIVHYACLYAGGDTWIIRGDVVDPDDNVANFIVRFYGVYDTRSAVDQYGHFEFAVILQDGQQGLEYAVTFDPHGQVSNIPFCDMGMPT